MILSLDAAGRTFGPSLRRLVSVVLPISITWPLVTTVAIKAAAVGTDCSTSSTADALSLPAPFIRCPSPHSPSPLFHTDAIISPAKASRLASSTLGPRLEPPHTFVGEGRGAPLRCGFTSCSPVLPRAGCNTCLCPSAGSKAFSILISP